MTWVQPLHTFVCGACGSRVTALYTLAALEKVMRVHAELCPGFPPPTDLPAADSEDRSVKGRTLSDCGGGGA